MVEILFLSAGKTEFKFLAFGLPQFSYSISKNPWVYYVLMKLKIDYVAYEHVL